MVLSRTEEQVGLQEAQIGCDAEGRDILAVPKFGTSMDRFAADNGYWDFDFVGKEIFKRVGQNEQTQQRRQVLTTSVFLQIWFGTGPWRFQTRNLQEQRCLNQALNASIPRFQTMLHAM